MEVTEPYRFIGFGAMEVTKPYEFIGFGAGNTAYQTGPRPSRARLPTGIAGHGGAAPPTGGMPYSAETKRLPDGGLADG